MSFGRNVAQFLAKNAPPALFAAFVSIFAFEVWDAGKRFDWAGAWDATSKGIEPLLGDAIRWLARLPSLLVNDIQWMGFFWGIAFLISGAVIRRVQQVTASIVQPAHDFNNGVVWGVAISFCLWLFGVSESDPRLHVPIYAGSMVFLMIQSLRVFLRRAGLMVA